MEVLQGTAGKLRFEIELDGEPVNLSDPPAVTITRDSSGEEIVSAAPAEPVDGEDGVFSYTLDPADTAEVELLHIVASTDQADATFSINFDAEIVGGFIASVAAITRNFDTDALVATIVETREIATRSLEDAAGVAFRPRYFREVLDGSGGRELLVTKRHLLRLITANLDDEDLGLDDLVLAAVGTITRPNGIWTGSSNNVELAYAHGHVAFPPAALPVIDLTRWLLTEAPSDYDQRATSISTGEATYSLITAGIRGNLFPLPSVNAFVQQYGFVSVG